MSNKIIHTSFCFISVLLLIYLPPLCDYVFYADICMYFLVLYFMSLKFHSFPKFPTL